MKSVIEFNQYLVRRNICEDRGLNLGLLYGGWVRIAEYRCLLTLVKCSSMMIMMMTRTRTCVGVVRVHPARVVERGGRGAGPAAGQDVLPPHRPRASHG